MGPKVFEQCFSCIQSFQRIQEDKCRLDSSSLCTDTYAEGLDVIGTQIENNLEQQSHLPQIHSRMHWSNYEAKRSLIKYQDDTQNLNEINNNYTCSCLNNF